MSVQIENLAAVPEWRLRSVQNEVDRIFVSLGVRIVWSRDMIRRPDVQSVTVVLLSPAMVSAKCDDQGLPDTVLASSIKTARRSWIFYDRVVRAAQWNGVDIERFLAKTIVHELGHIAGLLHSEQGIMRAAMEPVSRYFEPFDSVEEAAIRQSIVRSKHASDAQASYSQARKLDCTQAECAAR
jgi:hypothetical protein